MYHFIVNPNARSGFGSSIWDKAEQILQERHVEYQVHFTHCRRHATQIAADITSDNEEHTIIVLGGDGSINEVINGIQNPEKVTLGCIPFGSGNDFVRGTGFPSNTFKALDLLLTTAQVQKSNLGIMNYQGKSRRFAVSSGIGYDAAICHQVCVSKLKRALNRIGLGKLAYVGLSLYQLWRCTPRRMRITLDDDRILDYEKVYFAAAFNLPYEGGGCKFCPDARPDDDLLDLIVIADVPKSAALTILPAVFFGMHTHFPGVHIFRCRRADIQSVPALPVHTDGEPVFLQHEISFSLEEKHIKIFTA